MKPSDNATKRLFLFKNIFRGLLWLIVIVIAFGLASNYLRDYLDPYVKVLYGQQFLLYGLFTASEVFFALIPPEFFMMIYIFNDISASQFVLNLMLLTFISYMAGVLDYTLGKQFSSVGVVKKMSTRLLTQYRPQFEKYGKYLLVAGAVTPVPFSAVCMIMGIAQFPTRPFLLISLLRILRFAAYGWVIWNVPSLFE